MTSSARHRLARIVVATSSLATRTLRVGDGSTLGGRLGLVVSPTMLSDLGRGRSVVLVSGTNGKTTTTRLIAEAIGEIGEVASSRAGANMPAGITTALVRAPHAPFAAIEVDESYLGIVADALAPKVIVLLNLSRDQLDRSSEVRALAQRWRDVLAARDAVVVANADDPLVTWAASAAPRVVWVATATPWHEDAHHCPSCGGEISYGDDTWHCGGCDFRRPAPDYHVRGDELVRSDGARFALTLALPGQFNRANAALAIAACKALGIDETIALARIAAVDDVAGRYGSVVSEGRSVRLLLAKNPAGWNALLELVRRDDTPIVIGINANVADGRDPSWLWDVPFELLGGRTVIATGTRARDLAVRLRHGGIAHRCVLDQRDAIATASGAVVDYIGNYTAFQSLRKSLEVTRPHVRTGHPTSSTNPLVDARLVALEITDQRGLAPRQARSTAHLGQRAESALRIVVVHPDLLGTYGDGGNARVLANRALWRGIDVELVMAPSREALPELGDVYLLGGGEDGPQERSATLLRTGALERAVDHGATVLGVCAGFQIIGRSFPAARGERCEGVGLLDVTTQRFLGPRSVGEILTETARSTLFARDSLLVGFENHQGHTTRGPGTEALSVVTVGTGNGDGTDGAVADRVIGTYLHGPCLARNPALADAILVLATGRKLAALDDSEELALYAERVKAARQARKRRGRSAL